MNNNVTGYNVHQLIFGSSGTSGRTIAGNALSVNDWGGADPKIENQSTGSHTISLNITGDPNAGDPLEINPVSGDLTISGTINNNGSGINVYGNNGKMLTLSGIVSGSGKLIIQQSSLVKISAASTYTGNSEINAGELWFATGGSANSSTIFVGNGGTLSTTAKVWIESGGISISSPITVNNGNANTRVIGGLNTSGTATYSGAINLNAGDVNLEAASGGTVEFTGAITTTGGKYVTKVGSGLVILSGSGNNTGIGANVNAGTLRLAKASSGTIRALNAAPIVNSGGTLQLGGTGGDQIANVAVTVNSGGTFDLNGASESVSGVTLNGQGVGSAGALVNNSGTAATLTGAVTLGSEGWIGGSGELTIASAVGGAFNIVKVGSGTARLSANNTYSGVTYINNGTLRVSSATQSTSYEIGNTAGNNNASLNLDGGITLARAITLRSGTSGTRFVANTAGTSGTATFSGNLTANAGFTLFANTGGSVTLSGATINLNGNTMTVDGDGGSATISGPISGTGGSLVKNGGSTSLTLSGANSYTGNTTINAGTLQISGSADRLPTGTALTLANTSGAILNLNNLNQTIASLTGGGTTGGNVTLGSGVLTVSGTSSTSYGGIISGSGGLTKAGSSTLTLTGANTYTGATTINAGSLQISGSMKTA